MIDKMSLTVTNRLLRLALIAALAWAIVATIAAVGVGLRTPPPAHIERGAGIVDPPRQPRPVPFPRRTARTSPEETCA